MASISEENAAWDQHLLCLPGNQKSTTTRSFIPMRIGSSAKHPRLEGQYIITHLEEKKALLRETNIAFSSRSISNRGKCFCARSIRSSQTPRSDQMAKKLHPQPENTFVGTEKGQIPEPDRTRSSTEVQRSRQSTLRVQIELSASYKITILSLCRASTPQRLAVRVATGGLVVQGVSEEPKLGSRSTSATSPAGNAKGKGTAMPTALRLQR